MQYSAQSNPNINRIPRTSNETFLARSSSHPPEIFCWEEHAFEPCPSDMGYTATHPKEVQTDCSDFIHTYIKQNPEHVLRILGLDPDLISYPTRMRKSCSIPGNRSKPLKFCNNLTCNGGVTRFESNCATLYWETNDVDNSGRFFDSVNSGDGQIQKASNTCDNLV